MPGDDDEVGDVDGVTAPRAPSLDPFLESKLRPPLVRAGWVERPRLLDLLDASVRRPIALVSAPAGYGKTTLAAQWLASRGDARAVAWVALDAGDNDPARLWTHVAVALERAGCVLAADVTAFMSGRSGDLVTGVLPKLLGVLASLPDELVILLDDFQCITNPECHHHMAFFVENLPPQVHLVVLSRADPGLRLGKLRASGLLGEIRADALRFTVPEASSLLAAEGVGLRDDDVTKLLMTTEGWPAGLYLAALALAGRRDAEGFVRRFSGNDRFVGEYFSEEVLAGQPEAVRELILKISLTDRFCASLCDFVTGATNSAAVLQELERQNLFLVPLDVEGRWFRFHHLFSAMARGQLEVLHPELVPSLHHRAAQWFGAHGHADEAVTHLLAAGRTRDAAELVQANLLAYVDGGRARTVQSWLGALGTESIHSHPPAAVAAAWVSALMDDQRALDQYVDHLASVHDHGPLPDHTHSVESALALLQGMVGNGGPTEMMANARRAAELETDARTVQYAMAQRSLGHAAYVLGDLAAAVGPLTEAVHSEAALPVVRLMAMSEHSLVHAELGRHEVSAQMAERAMEIAEEREMYAMAPARSLAFTALGQAQATAGKADEAMATLEQGAALTGKLPGLGPWPRIHHLLVMSRVAVEVGDRAVARELVRDLGVLLSRFPDGMDAMETRLSVVRAALNDGSGHAVLEEPLTERELDVLRLLQRPASLADIAQQLYLSPNTVKTHAQAIYRKLGAHSRRDAVMIGKHQGLI